MTWEGFESLVRAGDITLLAIALLAIETLALLLIARRPPVLVVANGLSGLFLILALHAALVGSGIAAVTIWLALGGLAHVADLAARLKLGA